MSRRALLGLVAVLVPACLAAAIVFAVAGDGTSAPAATSSSLPTARGLARVAEVQAGRPVRAAARGPRPAPPARISIPAARVEAPVDPVAQRRGFLRVPAIGRAGWFRGGPRPGEVGRSVIIGHLDTRQGPGLFARLPSAPEGTRVAVTDRRGRRHLYTIVGHAQVAKDRFPTDAVYGAAAGPVLVLVTCGGEFVEGEGYEDNILVYARPA